MLCMVRSSEWVSLPLQMNLESGTFFRSFRRTLHFGLCYPDSLTRCCCFSCSMLLFCERAMNLESFQLHSIYIHVPNSPAPSKNLGLNMPEPNCIHLSQLSSILYSTQIPIGPAPAHGLSSGCCDGQLRSCGG